MAEEDVGAVVGVFVVLVMVMFLCCYGVGYPQQQQDERYLFHSVVSLKNKFISKGVIISFDEGYSSNGGPRVKRTDGSSQEILLFRKNRLLCVEIISGISPAVAAAK